MRFSFGLATPSRPAFLPALALALALAPALALALLAAGCGSKGSTQLVCEPTCPGGTHCEESGCVPDEPAANVDLSVAGSELGGCQPACVGATPFCNASGRCVACLADADCPAGQVCAMVGSVSLCAPGCKDDETCKKLGESFACCHGACVDGATDPANCGGCDNACVANHAVAMCSGGQCSVGACLGAWGDCNRSSDDGCEVNLHVDPANCGACASACQIPHALAGCAETCYIAACQFGFDDCNSDAKDGCETSVLSDSKNCGACGAVCMKPPHATATCVNKACQVSGCDQGYADCDGNPVNGCEVVVASDNNNCGKCGNACAQGLVCRNSGCTCPMCNIPNAKTACVNNVCTLESCVPGFGDCNLDPKDGCEADLTSDKLSCGACANACPQNAMNCINGKCMAGFTHHDGLGETWIDNIPTGTLTLDQAAMACKTYVQQRLNNMDMCQLNGCGCGNQDLCVYNLNANPRYTWFYNNGAMGGQVTLNCCGCQKQGTWD